MSVWYHEGTVKELKAHLGRRDRIREYFDVQELVQNTSQYDFFSASESGGNPRSNYVSMPLQGNLDRVIVAQSLETTLKMIKSDSGNSIDALQIANILRFGSLQILVDRNERKLVHHRITRYWSPEAINTNSAGGDATASADEEVATIRSRGLVPLSHQIGVANQQDATLRLQLDSASNLPTSANWTSSSQGADELFARCGIQVVEGPHLIRRLKAAA